MVSYSIINNALKIVWKVNFFKKIYLKKLKKLKKKKETKNNIKKKLKIIK